MTAAPLALELCCGTARLSAELRRRGWRVLAVDVLADRRRAPDVLADVRALPLREDVRPDLVWASPPCTVPARASLCHVRPPFGGATAPTLDEWREWRALVDACRAWMARGRFSGLENVRGAWRELGPSSASWGGVHVWGTLPLASRPRATAHPKCGRGGLGRMPRLSALTRAAYPPGVVTWIADAADAALRQLELPTPTVAAPEGSAPRKKQR